MGGQLLLQVGGVDINHIILSHDTGSRAMVAEWNTESATFVVDKAVKGDLSLRTEIEQQ